MYKPSIRTVGLLVLAFAWTLALAGSPATLTAPTANDDARNTCDQGYGIGASVQQPGGGGQDVLTWANKAVIPTEGVSRTAGVWAPDGKFHLICGNCQTHTSHPTDQLYDPTSNTWADGLTHPAGGGYGVHNHDACIIGDTIYVGGGSSNAAFYDNLTAIDVSGNTWTVLTAMPAASLLYYSFAACNGKVYCFGGTTDQSTCLSTVYEYDPAGGAWAPKTAMPDVRRNPVCATWGDTIYVIGGFATVAAYTGTTTMWKYCPSTDQWTTGTAFSAGTGWGRGVVYDDPALGPTIYVIGGYNAAAAIVNTVSTYSVNTGVWGSETPEIGGRRSHAADISSDGKIFVAGGYNGAILATTEMAIVAPAAGVDVGVTAIRVPGTQVVPGAPLNPSGVVRNYGTTPQSNIPVTCTVDSMGTLVYNHNLTITGPVNAGDTATALFSTAWTPGTSPFYTVKMFTALTGDTTRANDTARVVATTWVSIAVPTDSADRIVHATVYDPVGDKIYMIGGNPAGVSATYLALNQQYDPVANTWANKAPMSAARGWVTGDCVRGKIYVIGGHNNSSAAVATNECYDPVGDNWTTVAARPRAAMSALSATWRDSLIYIMGGWDGVGASGMTFVDVYNPFTNTWATGTALPQNADMGGAAILGDTIYITNAVARATSSCWLNLFKGYIDPTNPATITWIQGPALASPTSITGACAVSGKIVWLGGFINLTTPTNRVWTYDPATGAITDFPANYLVTVARQHNVVGREVAHELYVIAGDADCNWAVPNRTYAKIVIPNFISGIEDVHPVTALSVLSAVRPNPTTGSALVSYSVAKPGHAGLYLYNVSGRQVAKLYEGQVMTGTHRLSISTASLAKGIYVIKLRTSDATANTKLIVE
jgi:N-acetylneuraminic acid mutarotase